MNSVRKQLSRYETEIIFNRGNPPRRVFLVSDSKGRYLEEQIKPDEPKFFEVIYKGGAKIDDTELFNDLSSNIKDLNEPLILIWLGTCEFTTKRGAYVHLNKTTVADFRNKLVELKTKIHQENSTSEIIFLQCPVYSIMVYNEDHRHPNSAIFEADDLDLIEKIRLANEEISLLNRDFTGPLFSRDLLKNTKRKHAGETEHRSNYVYKFGDLYCDGIHPKDILAELWLRKIQKIACDFCF